MGGTYQEQVFGSVEYYGSVCLANEPELIYFNIVEKSHGLPQLNNNNYYNINSKLFCFLYEFELTVNFLNIVKRVNK